MYVTCKDFLKNTDLWLHLILAELESPGVVARNVCRFKHLPRWLLWSARCRKYWSLRAICLITKKIKSWNSKGRSLKEQVSLSPTPPPKKILGRLWFFKHIEEKLLWLKQKRSFAPPFPFAVSTVALYENLELLKDTATQVCQGLRWFWE